MEFILPNSLSALREDETFTRHNITIDPNAFLAVIRHAELGCKIGKEGQEFHNEVDKRSFEELMPEDPALYDVRVQKERVYRGINGILLMTVSTGVPGVLQRYRRPCLELRSNYRHDS
jgi:hypothetical protein